MTLWVYSSATYIVCVLDSEGQRMGLETLYYKRLWNHCTWYIWRNLQHSIFFFFFKVGSNPAHSWWQSAEEWTRSRLCFSVSRRRSKRGSAPRGRHCRMRPSLLLASPTWTWPWSLRSSAHVIQSSALATQACQKFWLLAQKVFERVLEWRMNGVWWRFSALLAEAQRVSHKESEPGRK